MTAGCRAVWETGDTPFVATLVCLLQPRSVALILPVRRAHMRYAWVLPVMWLGAFLFLLGALKSGGVLESLDVPPPTSSISGDFEP